MPAAPNTPSTSAAQSAVSVPELLDVIEQKDTLIAERDHVIAERDWVTVAVKVSVASKYIYAATFSGMTSGSRAGLSATVPTGFQLRVLPLQRFGF